MSITNFIILCHCICIGVQHDEDVRKLNHALKQLQDVQQQAQVCMC